MFKVKGNKNKVVCLSYFRNPIEISVPKSAFDKAEKFAQEVIGTISYKDSYKATKAKIQKDFLIGTLGTHAVYSLFKIFTDNVSKPNHKVYKGKKKFWSPDLFVNNVGLSVKTQKSSSSKKYGLSWVFQHSNKRKDPVLRNPKGWICFVKFDEGTNKFKVFPPVQVRSLKFREPKLYYLVGKKKVVYASDLSSKYT